MAEHFDVVIVGGRCAGASLAILLGRAGLRVCVVDRAQFPSETLSTHGVQPCGVKILDDLGVLEPLSKTAALIESATLAFDDVKVELSGASELMGAPMLNARRITMDTVLLDAAAAAGAEVRTQTAVTGLLEDGDRVVGVETRTGELRARLVVGADGARSTVARLVNAPEYDRTPAGRVLTWAYFEGATAPASHMWLGKIGDLTFLASPTDSDLFLAAVGLSINRKSEVIDDRETSFADGLGAWPELNSCVAGARRVGPIRVMSRWHGFFRQSAGPGWVLVGDAGHFWD